MTNSTAPIPTWQKILSEFLVKRRVLSEEQVEAHLRFFGSLDRRFGQLSQLKGYLSLADVLSILEAQAQGGGGRFGEVAVAGGKLTPDQVQKVAALQKNPSDLFLESLVFAERVAADRLPALIADLQAFLAERSRTTGPPPLPPGEAPRLSREDVRAVFRRVKSIGALPGVIQRLLALTEKPDVELGELEKAVVADPSLTAQLLRVVNSAAFGAYRSISTVRDAIGRIGIKGLRNVALATVLLDRFKGADRDAMRRIWAHSVLTAQWAQALAAARGLRAVAEDAFIAGLVHDVGKTVLRQFFPEYCTPLEEGLKAGRPLDEVERDLFGQPHEDVGAYLCDLWEFPAAITQAVAYHHLPPATFKAMPGVQALAGCVHGGCRLADVPLKPDDPAGNRKLLEGLDPELRAMHRIEPAMADLFPQVHAKARDLASWVS